MRCARVYPSAGKMPPVVPFVGNGVESQDFGCTPKTIVFDFNFQLCTDWRSTKTNFSLPPPFLKSTQSWQAGRVCVVGSQ
jgi:hypothetical protein